MDFIKIVNEAFATGKSHPAFRSGDTITVDYRISEGVRSVSSAIVASSSASAVTVTRSVSRFVRSAKV